MDNGATHISTNATVSRYKADALHQLRPVPPLFTGRTAEVEQLVTLLTADTAGDSAHSRVIRIEGISGTGKTALAVCRRETESTVA